MKWVMLVVAFGNGHAGNCLGNYSGEWLYGLAPCELEFLDFYVGMTLKEALLQMKRAHLGYETWDSDPGLSLKGALWL